MPLIFSTSLLHPFCFVALPPMPFSTFHTIPFASIKPPSTPLIKALAHISLILFAAIPPIPFFP